MNDPRDIRLIPPPMEEYKVLAKFRFIGEEAPRIWGFGVDPGIDGWQDSSGTNASEYPGPTSYDEMTCQN